MELATTTDRKVTVDEAIAIAIRLQQSEQWAAADDIYRQVLAVKPDCADALHFSGVLAHQRGRREQGVRLIEKSLELEPDRADWHSNLGIVLQAQLRLEDAAAAYRRAIELDPGHANAHSNLGVVLRALGKPEESEAAYREAIAINPAHIDAHMNLGALLLSLGRTPEAVRCFCRVITLRPKQADARRHLALAHVALGELDEATKIFEQWLKEEPDSFIARHMLAACSRKDVPPRCSDEFLEATFDSFAATFDAKLAKLGYRGPQLMAVMLEETEPEPSKSLDVLDAGCGTGLCGPFVAPYARRLVGVDLSAKMLAHARERDVYDELVKSELTAYLRSVPASYDLIVSTDTLIYFGPLEELTAAVAGALRPGGRFVFTVEALTDASDSGYTICPHGRYSHARDYIDRTLRAVDLEPEIAESELRLESGVPVPGFVVKATKPVAQGIRHA